MTAEAILEETKENVKESVKGFKKKGITPGLAIILTVDDPTQKKFAEFKKRDCDEVEIYPEICELYKYPPETVEKRSIETIEELNKRDDINGVIIQMPLPSYIDEDKPFEVLSYEKDIDGLTLYNQGIWRKKKYDFNNTLLPCTAAGIIELLKRYGISVKEEVTAIIGRSKLVGGPLRELLEQRDSTVICCHTQTPPEFKYRIIKDADIVVSAAGRPPELYKENSFRLTADMIKEGAVVVNVGMRKDPTNPKKWYFDLPDGEGFDRIKEKASYVTSLLGCVGLMTRGRVLKNTIIATNLCEKYLNHRY